MAWEQKVLPDLENSGAQEARRGGPCGIQGVSDCQDQPHRGGAAATEGGFPPLQQRRTEGLGSADDRCNQPERLHSPDRPPSTSSSLGPYASR